MKQQRLLLWLFRALVIVSLPLAVTACDPQHVAVDALSPATPLVRHVSRPRSILFIGNSFTYFNGGVGLHLKKLAESANEPVFLRVGDRTTPNQTLAGHFSDPRTTEALKEFQWDLVVLQGASAEPIRRSSRTSFFDHSKKLITQIRAQGSEAALFMTWAYRGSPSMTPVLRNAYVDAGNAANTLVVPAGLAWDHVLAESGTNARLYSDSRHPSDQGTYLAACVFYGTLFGRSPEGLPYRAQLAGDVARRLQTAAWRTVTAFYGRNAMESEATLKSPYNETG